MSSFNKDRICYFISDTDTNKTNLVEAKLPFGNKAKLSLGL